MAVFNEPTKWAQSLGATANADVIPDEAGAMDVDISKIFPAVFSVPLSQGGKAIPRRTLNGILKLLGDWLYFYQQGGIPSYNAAYDYIPGRVVLYDNNLYKCIQANGASSTVVAPTDSTYWAQIPTYADLFDWMPTGVVLPFGGPTIPEGFLICNGAAISRTTYANLFDKIGTTYGSGNGSTTFNIPDLRDRYVIGVNTNALGTQIAEQLPNITGSFVAKIDATNALGIGKANGALTTNSQPVYSCATTGSYTAGAFISLDASFSNATYSNNGHVYPQSIALNFIIKT